MQSVFKSTTHTVTSYYHRLCVCVLLSRVRRHMSVYECVCVFAVLQRPPPLNWFYKSSAALYVGDNPPWGVLYTPTSPVSQPAASRSQWNIHELRNQLYPFQPLHSPSLLLNPNPHWQLFMLSRAFLKTNTFKCLFFFMQNNSCGRIPEWITLTNATAGFLNFRFFWLQAKERRQRIMSPPQSSNYVY